MPGGALTGLNDAATIPAKGAVSSMLNRLDILENQSVFILREAYHKIKGVALLWSIGKDSTVLLWLVRKAFLGRCPFPVVHIDTSYKIPEMIQYRDEVAKKLDLNLIVGANKEALKNGMGPQHGRLECCKLLKTIALQQTLDENQWRGLILGIRRDEDPNRAKERFFSPRDPNFQWNYKDQPPEFWDQYQIDYDPKTHVRIHPLLSWTELDIWQYIQRENIPVIPLYFARNGQRYRSLGCAPCTGKIPSEASTVSEIIGELTALKSPERSGRAQDLAADYAMEKLRVEGYM